MTPFLTLLTAKEVRGVGAFWFARLPSPKYLLRPALGCCVLSTSSGLGVY